MPNIDVRVIGTANVTQMSTAFGRVEAQVAALNAQLARMVTLQNGVDPRGYQRMASAAAGADRAFRSAVASTGMFEAQQLRVNRATDTYIDQLNRQKLSFRDMIKQRKIAAAAYKEQLAMEQMMVRQGVNSNSRGRQNLDVMIPREVSSDMDTMGRRLAFFNEQLRSGAHQMVNWGKNTQWAGRQLMVGLTMPILAVGAAAGVMAYQIDKELTRIAKVYDTTADANATSIQGQMAYEKELADVRTAGVNTAIKAAKEYGQAATDTLNVQAELAATGKQGAELQQATAEVMRISRLGELDYQDSIAATIALQSVFRMSNEELTESFNYMNAVENATSLSTQDFATAIPIAAAPIKAFGGDIKELGVLLTAMKEQGIEASQGANALKATMQRLGRPSKQIQQEFAKLTGGDIIKLVDESGSLTEIFTKLNHITEDLSAQDQRKVFAGLFGSYQVTKMMALTKGMGDLEDGIGQVSTAYELSNGSAAEWADTAEREIERYQQSISGQFDTALQEMKIQLSTLGEPFVEIATVVLKGISTIISGFNKLPGAVKTSIAVMLGLAAVAGPVIMLAGLFANLFGNLLKGVATFTNLFVNMRILGVESRAARMAAGLASAGFVEQRNSAEMLTATLNRLTAASAASTAAAVAGATASARAAGGASGYMHGPNLPTNQQREGLYFDQTAGRRADGSGIATQTRLEQARVRLAEEHMRANGQVARDSATTAQNTARTNNMMAGAAASTAAMGAGMLLMMGPFNETTQHIGKWLMIAAIAVPAVKALGALLLVAGKGAATLAKGIYAAVVGSGSLVARLGVVRAAMLGIMGPVGWVVAGLTAAAGVMFYFKKKADEAAKALAEQRKHQADLVNQGEAWAETQERAVESWKQYQHMKQTSAQQETFDRDVEFYQSEDQAKTTEAFGGLDDDAQKNLAILKYIQQMKDFGQSSAEAQKHMEAFFFATGMGMSEAQRRTKELADEFGNLTNLNWSAEFADTFEYAAEELANGNVDAFKNIGMQAGQMFNEGYLSGTREQSQEMFSDLTERLTTPWEDIASKISKVVADDKTAQWFNKDLPAAAAKGGAALRDFYMGLDSEQRKAALKYTSTGVTGTAGTISALQEAAEASYDLESGIISGIAEASGFDKAVNTLGELAEVAEFAARMLNYKDSVTAAKELDIALSRTKENLEKETNGDFIAKAFGKSQTEIEMANAEILNTEDSLAAAGINAMNMEHGFKQGETAAEALYNLVNRVKDETNAAAGAARSMAFAWKASVEEMQGIRKDAMTSVMQDIVDNQSDQLDAQREAEEKANSAMWDNRLDAQQNAFDKEQRAMDSKWENKNDAAETYWDNRVKAVQDAIEAEEKAEEKRQKMFDAEIARIQKLNEAMNRNIDFNVALNEGNFDEAAKIRNDVSAAAGQSTLEAAAAAGSGRTDKRVNRLEGQAENIEEARDAYMKDLKKKEDAERRHLDKVQKMREKALQRERDASVDALNATWEARKKANDRAMEMFMATIPRTEKELKKHIANTEFAYTNYGERLMANGEMWAKDVHKNMLFYIRQAGRDLKSDKVWEQLGSESMKNMLKGMGFTGWKQFKHFVETGEMKDFPGPKNGKSGSGDSTSAAGPRGDQPITYHRGGMVDGGPGSGRAGVARTTRGLHHSETMARVQKGEYIVNKDAAAKNKSLLDTVNSGSPFGHDGDGRGNLYGEGGPGQGPAGMLAAMLSRGIMTGTAKAVSRANDKKKAEVAAAQAYGSQYSGVVGGRKYALPGVKPWVYEAAQYLGNKFNIATIGGVGQRSSNPTSDHPRGLALDFMTSDVAKGSALSEEAIRLWKDLDATYLIWRARIHSFDSRGWQGYSHPSGATDPTSMHMDHVHVSFSPTGDVGDLPALTAGGSVSGGFVQGTGGMHRPVPTGSPGSLHYNNAVDIGVGTGTPVYAVADGVVTSSRDIAGPLSSDTYNGDGPYGSYGRVIQVSHGAFDTLYAHLSNRMVNAGQEVRGGAKIGLSGNTGNSSGPHLHFEAHGASPYAFLKKGGTIKNDNTPAVLHKDERVLSAPLTSKLDAGIDAIYKATKNRAWQPAGQAPQAWGPWGSTPEDKKKRRTPYDYPMLQTGMADSPYTWFSSEDMGGKKGSKKGSASNSAGSAATEAATADSGNKSGLRIGTLNTWVKASAKATISDIARLLEGTDFLALTEMGRKLGSVRKFLSTRNWGVVGGGNRDQSMSVMAYNKATQELLKSGQRKLGDRMANVVGGREKRYANYGQFLDKDSGRKTWQVAAHTVPAGRGLNAKNGPLYREQWGNLNKLVEELQGTGIPTFVSGDLNVHQSRDNFQTPGNLNEFASKGVDYVFGDKKMSELMRQWTVGGMHSDHGGALMSQFTIPGLKTGGTIKYDNTIANLHKDEKVLTAKNTRALDQGLQNLASGGGKVHNDIKVYGTPGMDEEMLANKVVAKIQRQNSRLPGSRK